MLLLKQKEFSLLGLGNVVSSKQSVQLAKMQWFEKRIDYPQVILEYVAFALPSDWHTPSGRLALARLFPLQLSESYILKLTF